MSAMQLFAPIKSMTVQLSSEHEVEIALVGENGERLVFTAENFTERAKLIVVSDNANQLAEFEKGYLEALFWNLQKFFTAGEQVLTNVFSNA